ncbi:protein adenylyltransferase SelO [Luteibacter rhizovicinus]|nr:YdiU family protein [Luteibacter rhizovicinus]
MRSLRFDNAFVRELPADDELGGRPRQVEGAAYSFVSPTPVAAPRVIAVSREVLALLDMPADVARDPEFARVFAGNELLPGMQSYAANYGGHQFGHWAGQLGDGRAIGLGEAIGRGGVSYELQLKGAGRTPYSRGADGRAVLRSSIREFLCSEAMHHLGVPTTRALSLVATGDSVMRDMFYDGHPEAEPGAIVCRVAPSFLRFGSYELPSSRNDVPLLRRLVDHTIRHGFPHYGIAETYDERIVGDWFGEVCERTATLMAHWMRVGFVHGVMNTDNMSILGLTIDYGPYGWIDNFDMDWTPNTTDRQHRRYRFGQQPQIAYWNLHRLAQALSPLFSGVEALQEGLGRYAARFEADDSAFTAAKLGLSDWREGDEALAQSLREVLTAGEMDMTLFFRALGRFDPQAPDPEVFSHVFYDAGKREATEASFRDWLARYSVRLREDGASVEQRGTLMNAANPVYVLRNYLAQQAIDRATDGDDGGVLELLELLRRPYDEQPGKEAFAARRPDWAREKAGCSMLSCSS